MTVTNITQSTGEAETILLVRRVFEEIAAASRRPDLTAVHEVIREAGIRNARRALAEAPDHLAAAQKAYREAQAVEAAAKDRYGEALLEADYIVEGSIHSEGNKRYRWVPCVCVIDTGAAKDCAICDGTGKYRRFMLADDVKVYKAGEAAKVPAVVTAALDLREAEEATAAARDAVTVADKRMGACRADLEAACAELNALALGLAAKGA